VRWECECAFFLYHGDVPSLTIHGGQGALDVGIVLEMTIIIGDALWEVGYDAAWGSGPHTSVGREHRVTLNCSVVVLITVSTGVVVGLVTLGGLECLVTRTTLVVSQRCSSSRHTV
jgi:hypothetical protein